MLQTAGNETIRFMKAMKSDTEDYYARKFFGKPFTELNSSDRLDIQDLIDGDND